MSETAFIGVALGLIAIVYFTMELTAHNDNGKGMKSFFKAFKGNFLFVIPLFALAVAIYYIFVS